MEFSINENDRLILYGGFNFHLPNDGYEVEMHQPFLFRFLLKGKQAGQSKHKSSVYESEQNWAGGRD
jgi:hypothetical protein